MELRHLITFQTIIQEGSFLRAAEKLQYAQSTITLHVQQLEADLGANLFARRGKRVQLTEAGRALLEQADALILRAKALQQTMKDIVLGNAGHIHIGTVTSGVCCWLPSLLTTFLEERPNVHVTVETGTSHHLNQRVAAGLLDVAICSSPEAHLNLLFEPMFTESMLLLLPEQHPLAAKEAIMVRDLANMRLLLSGHGCSYRRLIETTLIQRGLNPFAKIEFASWEMLKQAVLSGLGLAIVPASAMNSLPAGLVLRELDNVTMQLPIGLVYTAEKSEPVGALQAFMHLLRSYLKKDQEALEELRSSTLKPDSGQAIPV
ncbi:DNA-binding transcriptional LysR family regulator [Thermosporothrix hazakensis]|jgi:DNA-binding transcriptional LysR family regulator|uniref:DNA-binding transcriptional LysR family regulator n=1 Tax=Thermosporothrix hazakensis TaxID=644383 RepID=A0A326U9M2_THEHA|nr:LysR family transcriptional regulator [Thermosporothrix hazakensis]PZW31113.1 DNA-binding transcriptional LysR family regulator [Thermosporothrix hazakensis]GCE50973.1 LysR family transcriptional regulator [Thermosporothrix hazakensis]